MSTAERVADSLPENDTDPLLGMVINQKFKITQAIAVGGMGTIYRGEQLVLARPVAIKVLNPSYTANLRDPAFQKRFFLEASILSRLQHPNIVTVFDYGRIDGMEADRFFMAMEFLPGETLHRRLRSRGRLTPPEAIAIARQLARGLREAHKHGVVHRDMKPSNVMLVPDEDGIEIVKILDFGLGKVLSDDSEELTQQGSFLGSPRYMSPEQIAHGKVDHRTDVYSLGVMLYQMLCGKVPFESDKSVQILIAHLQAPVPPMKQRNPEVDIPEALENFVRRCLEKNPDNRPGSMEDFVRQLRECASSLGLTAGFGMTGTASTLDNAPPAVLTPISGMHGAPPFRPSPIPPNEDAEVVLTSDGPEEISLSAPHAGPPPLRSTRHSQANPVQHAHSIPIAPTERDLRNAESSASSRFGLIVGGAGLLMTIAAFVVLAMRQPQQMSVPVQVVPSGPQSPRSFTLLIESVPQGAEVFDGDRRLGTTPLQLSISNESVRVQSRNLSVRHEGYQQYSIVQGPSDERVHVVAALQPLPSNVPQNMGNPQVPTTQQPEQVRVIYRTRTVTAPSNSNGGSQGTQQGNGNPLGIATER